MRTYKVLCGTLDSPCQMSPHSDGPPAPGLLDLRPLLSRLRWPEFAVPCLQPYPLHPCFWLTTALSAALSAQRLTETLLRILWSKFLALGTFDAVFECSVVLCESARMSEQV